jgi:lipopolysaccharide transport system permease protein
MGEKSLMQLVQFQSWQIYYELLLAWTQRTVQARYKQSVLGILWAISQPAAQVAIFTLIFVYVIPVDTGDTPYPVFSYVAMTPWVLFSIGLTDMVTSLVANMGLVTKIYFPREILPTASLLARLLDFVIAMALLLLLLWAYGQPIHILGWLFMPVIVVVQLLFTLGLGFLGAAMNVFYRDVQHVIALILRIWFYLTPIIYPVSEVPEQYLPYYFLNPMTGLLESYRAAILFGELPGGYFITATVISIVVFIAGFWFFKRTEFQFADVV